MQRCHFHWQPPGADTMQYTGLVAEQPDYFYGGLREADKKVYIYSSEYPVWSEELVYDFNLSLGDAVPYYLVYDHQETAAITDTGHVVLNGVVFKTYTIFGDGGSSLIVEGLGSLASGLYPSKPYEDGSAPHTKLLCLTHNDTILYQAPYMECGLILPTSINSIETGATTFNVFPNPVQQSLYLDVDNHHTATVSIFNSIGEVVMSSEAAANTVDVSFLRPGPYWIRFFSDKGSAISKFVKE